MLGVNKRVIVSSTHLLVVERSYLTYNMIYKHKYKNAKVSFASNTHDL